MAHESDEATTTLTLRVSADLRDRLERLAVATERSRAWLAQDALEMYLDLNEWQVGKVERGMLAADAGDFADPAEVAAVFARHRRP